MIRKILGRLGALALAALISVPLAPSASALTSANPSTGDAYSSQEAMVIIGRILGLEKEKVAVQFSLSSATDRMAKLNTSLSEKDAEIKKLEVAVAAAKGKAKEALELKLRAVRFERTKIEAGGRAIANEIVRAKAALAEVNKKIAAEKAALAKLTNGACTVTGQSFACVM